VTDAPAGPGALHTKLVALEELSEHPENYNKGDDERVAELLARFGQWRPAVVQRSTGHVLIGNTMLRAARALGWRQLNVHYRDADDDEARRILVSDNRARDFSATDERALADLLRSFGDDLSGTLFDTDDVDDLLASLEEADAANPPQEPTALIPGGAPAGQAGAYGPDGAGTNVRTTPSYAEYEQQYSSRATRFMALNYPLAQYAWIVERLSKIADDEGVDNFAEAVLRLVEARTGETAPPLEEGERIGGPPSAIATLPATEEAPGD
jgi:hypothetical protein